MCGKKTEYQNLSLSNWQQKSGGEVCKFSDQKSPKNLHFYLIYKALKVNYLSEAEALRQAQIALITGNQIDTVSGERFVFIPRDVVREGGMPSSRLSHPYYWAPFVLIGNGL